MEKFQESLGKLNFRDVRIDSFEGFFVESFTFFWRHVFLEMRHEPVGKPANVAMPME